MPPVSPRSGLPVLLLAALAACRTPGAERDAGLPPAEDRRARAFTLAEVARSGTDAVFAFIGGLDVDSRGRIFVADLAAPEVAVLAPDGRLERTVGRRGGGPGEFRSVAAVQLLPGDSLLVFDPELARVSVFPPSLDSLAHTVSLASRTTTGAVQVRRAGGGRGMLAVFSRAYATRDDPRQDATRTDVVRRLTPGGSLARDSVLVVPSQQMLVQRQGGGVQVTLNPFGRESLIRFGPGDRIYHAWTDSLRVSVYTPDGERVGGFGAKHQPPPVSGVEVERWTERLGARFRPALAEAAKAGWPVMDQMVVDDRGRVWLRLAGGEDTREWVRFSGDGRYDGSVFLPAGTVIHLARGDRLYASADPEEEPYVAVLSLGPGRGRSRGGR